MKDFRNDGGKGQLNSEDFHEGWMRWNKTSTPCFSLVLGMSATAQSIHRALRQHAHALPAGFGCVTFTRLLRLATDGDSRIVITSWSGQVDLCQPLGVLEGCHLQWLRGAKGGFLKWSANSHLSANSLELNLWRSGHWITGWGCSFAFFGWDQGLGLKKSLLVRDGKSISADLSRLFLQTADGKSFALRRFSWNWGQDPQGDPEPIQHRDSMRTGPSSLWFHLHSTSTNGVLWSALTDYVLILYSWVKQNTIIGVWQRQSTNMSHEKFWGVLFKTVLSLCWFDKSKLIKAAHGTVLCEVHLQSLQHVLLCRS